LLERQLVSGILFVAMYWVGGDSAATAIASIRRAQTSTLRWRASYRYGSTLMLLAYAWRQCSCSRRQTLQSSPSAAALVHAGFGVGLFLLSATLPLLMLVFRSDTGGRTALARAVRLPT
jgi:hypothetical protein